MSNPIPRSKVKQSQTWNAESVFDSPEAFEAEANSILKSLKPFKKYQDHLGENPDTFIKAMEAMDKLSSRATKVQVYATMSSSVDATDQTGAAINGKAMSVIAQVNAALFCRT
jgi:oligoendopeptidase F